MSETGESENSPYQGKYPHAEVKALQKKLGSLLANLPTESVRLPISEEARAVFDEWYFCLDPGPFSKRLDTYGLRLMIILAINEREMSVTEDIARAVVKLLQWQLEVRRECDPVDAENNIAKMEEMIRRALARGPMEIRDLQRKVNYHRYGLFAWKSAIDNLCRCREVFFRQQGQNLFLGQMSCQQNCQQPLFMDKPIEYKDKLIVSTHINIV